MSEGVVQITVASLPDFQRLVAEVYIRGVFVGLISEETPGSRIFESSGLRIASDELVEALKMGRERLSQLDNEPNN